MTKVEKNVAALLGAVSLLWAGGLFAFYFVVQGSPAPAPLTPTALPPATVAAAGKVTPAPAGEAPGAAGLSLVTIAAPPIATTVAATGLPTPAEKRAHLEQGPVDEESSASASNPHGRWEDRTGIVLPPPPGLPATPVTIHIKDVSARKAFAEMKTATGVKLVVFPPYVWQQTPFPSAVTLDADARPMMEVVNELCAKVGVAGGARTTGTWGEGPACTDPANPVLGFQGQVVNGGLGPWVVTGPFAFEVQQVSHVARVLPGPSGPTDVGSLTVTLSMQHEPGVSVLGQQGQATVTVATDEAGHSLVAKTASPPTGAARPVGPNRSGLGGILSWITGGTSTAAVAPSQWQRTGDTFTASLACPPDVGRHLSHLGLTPKLLVADKSERVEIPIGAGHPGDTERAAAGLTVIAGAVNGGRQCSCLLTYQRGQQTDAEWEQLRSALANVVPVLDDASGRSLPVPQFFNLQSTTDRSIRLQCQWYQQQNGMNDTVLQPAKLILNVPQSIRVVDVPIEFNDLPLP